MTADRAVDDLTAVRRLVDVALQGATANERPDLVDRLTRAAALIASTTVSRSALTAVAATVVEALQTLEVDLRTREAILSEPGRPHRMLAELRHAERRLKEFEDRSADWPQLLNEGLSAVSADLEFEIRNRGRAVLDEGVVLIEAGRTTSAQFEEWLRARLVAEASACYERLGIGVHVTASRVATRLNLPAPAPVTKLPVMPPEQLAAQTGGKPRGSGLRSPLSGRLLGVVMPTYGGTMMTLVLPRFMGLVLPTWLIVTSAVVGALTMGGAAVAAERQRQRSRRDGETINSLRSTMESFQLALSKQIRDAVRDLHQDLRRYVSVAVSQHGRMVSAETNAARRAAEDTQRLADAVQDIRNDLSAIQDLRRTALQLVGRDSPAALPGYPQPRAVRGPVPQGS